MATVGSLVVNLLGNTQQFRSEFAQVPRVIAGVVGSAAALVGVGSGLAGIGRGLSLAGDAEQAQVAFEVMTGSAQRAKEMLGELRAYADKSPYSLAGNTESAKLLLNLGVAADQVLPTLRMLGDVAAGDENKLHSLALAFGQSSSAGRLMGGDLNQMINAGFNPLQEIANRTGESMTALKARMEAGGISTAEVTQAFRDATSEGGRFYGMTERQSGTLTGLYSTMRDTIDGTLRDIGQRLVDTFDLKSLVGSTTASIAQITQMISTYGESLARTGAFLIGFITTLGAFRTAMLLAANATRIAAAVQAFFMSMTPVGAIALVAAMIAGATAVTLMDSQLDSATQRMAELDQKAQQTGASVAKIGKPEGGNPLDGMLASLAEINALQAKGAGGNFGAKLAGQEETLLGRIDAMATFKDSVSPAEQALNGLHAMLATVRGAVDELGQARVDQLGANIEAQIGKLSGATDKIQALRDEILGVSQIDQDKVKLSRAGATNEQVDEFGRLSAEAARMKELRSSRDSLLQQTQTPVEKFQKELTDLKAMRDKNLINDEDFTRGKTLAETNLAKAELAKQNEGQKSNPKDSPLEAIAKGSKEAQQAILRGMQGGRDNPNKKLETLAEKQLRAQQKSEDYLSKLSDKDAPTQSVTVIDM